MASAYTDMKKTKLIGNIIQESKIHHNISMSWNKMPDYSEEDLKAGFDWQDEAQFMIDDFVEEWEERPENDCGNRNLCGCNSEKNKNHKPENIKKDGACKVHDLWHIYSYGRMGATLYWDKYWKGKNSGFGFKYDADELEEKNIEEGKKVKKALSEIEPKLKELNFFLLELDASDENNARLSVRGYPEEAESLATEHYLEAEKLQSGNPDKDVVLVGAKSIEELKKAYLNYFANSKEFLEI